MSNSNKHCSKKVKVKTYFVSYEQFPRRTKRCFKCTICQLNLSSKETLRKHILLKHIKLKPHLCIICGRSFIFEKSRILHEKTHEHVPFYKCSCGKEFEEKAAYRHHKKISHSEVLSPALLQCSFCHNRCVDKKQLRYHVQTRHAPRPIHCTFPSCKRLFPTNTLLNHHVRTHSVEKHTCLVCNKTFKLRSYLKRHQIIHKGIRPYKCPDCDKRYLNLSHLTVHRKRIHSHSDGYLCVICGKTSRNKYDLVLHEKAHKGEKQFECDLCNYKASFRASLYRHKKKHSTAVSAATTESENVTALRSESERKKKNIPHYLRISSETKPFKCVDCDSTFASAVRANEHWRRYHFVRSEFKCHICKTVFNDQIHFYAHKESHQGEGQFKCNVCNYKTAFKIGLHAHKKIHFKTTMSTKLLEKNDHLLPHNRLSSLENLPENHSSGDSSPNIGSMTEQDSTTIDEENNVKEKMTVTGQEIFDRSKDCISLVPDGSFTCDKSPNLPKVKHTRLKPRKGPLSPLYCQLNSTHDVSLWEADESFNLSIAGLLSDQSSLDSVRDLDRCSSDGRSSRREMSANVHATTPSNRNLPQGFSFSQRRDPNITLNCTAAQEEEIKFYNSHFL